MIYTEENMDDKKILYHKEINTTVWKKTLAVENCGDWALLQSWFEEFS